MLSFKKKKHPPIPLEELELLQNAQKRIRQRKDLYSHIVVLLLGRVYKQLINKIFIYGVAYDWSLWAIEVYGLILVLHIVNVHGNDRFMGGDWERRQRERLVALQREKFAEIQKEIETVFPLSAINKKKGE